MSLPPAFTAPAASAPTWIRNPQKRVVPNHLAARSSKRADAVTALAPRPAPASDFDLALQFGHMGGTARTATTGNAVESDLPPAKSMYDWVEPLAVEEQAADLFVRRDPRSFANVFNRKGAAEPAAITPLAPGEAAVLVFGYNELVANEVISHFRQYGPILEDFAVLRANGPPPPERTPAPIFLGSSWVKLTYDNPALALRALEDNGLFYLGRLIGVVPYTKTTVEKLTQKLIAAGDDVGDTSRGATPLKPVFSPGGRVGVAGVMPSPASAAGTAPASAPASGIKDGHDLFFREEVVKKEEKPKQGVVGAVGSYFFGWGSL